MEVRVEVLTAVPVKFTVYWNMSPYSVVDIYSHFGRAAVFLGVEYRRPLLENLFNLHLNFLITWKFRFLPNKNCSTLWTV
jgi:hypothetical protein